MDYLYTVREIFDESHGGWQTYVQGSRLYHVKEIISLDALLNKDLVEPDYETVNWEMVHSPGSSVTGYLADMHYALSHMRPVERFNLLAIVIQPEEDCSNAGPADFEFAGYDLVDKSYETSALTNCGGFGESFLPHDQNKYGLVNNYNLARSIQKHLAENNPMEFHADTLLVAVWRHKKLGHRNAE